MKESKRSLLIGMALLLGFTAILVGLFSPLVDGQKPITYLDDLYNSISKGSVYYIPKLQEEAIRFKGGDVEFSLGVSTQRQAEEMTHLFGSVGSKVTKTDNSLLITGSLDKILQASLADSDQLFKNQGDALTEKYGFGERNALYYWWLGLKAINKQLTRENRFEEATFVNAVTTRAVECSYNYYGVEPKNISTEIMFVVISLLFYVVYTLWFGFAILHLFVGLGLKLEH